MEKYISISHACLKISMKVMFIYTETFPKENLTSNPSLLKQTNKQNTTLIDILKDYMV